MLLRLFYLLLSAESSQFTPALDHKVRAQVGWSIVYRSGVLYRSCYAILGYAGYFLELTSSVNCSSDRARWLGTHILTFISEQNRKRILLEVLDSIDGGDHIFQVVEGAVFQLLAAAASANPFGAQCA